MAETDTRDDRRERLVALGLVVLLTALLATAGVLWWRQRPADAASAVLTSARTAATTFFDLDHTTIEQDIDAMAALTTGEFADSYGKERARLAEQVTRKKLVVTAEVPDRGTALEYLHDDDAQVLVAVDATTRDASGAAEKEHYRIRVVLSRVEDRWLVSGLEQVG